jgi:hypothetical protein
MAVLGNTSLVTLRIACPLRFISLTEELHFRISPIATAIHCILIADSMRGKLMKLVKSQVMKIGDKNYRFAAWQDEHR